MTNAEREDELTARHARQHTRIFATTAEGWKEIDRRDAELRLRPRDRVTGLPFTAHDHF